MYAVPLGPLSTARSCRVSAGLDDRRRFLPTFTHSPPLRCCTAVIVYVDLSSLTSEVIVTSSTVTPSIEVSP